MIENIAVKIKSNLYLTIHISIHIHLCIFQSNYVSISPSIHHLSITVAYLYSRWLAKGENRQKLLPNKKIHLRTHRFYLFHYVYICIYLFLLLCKYLFINLSIKSNSEPHFNFSRC